MQPRLSGGPWYGVANSGRIGLLSGIGTKTNSLVSGFMGAFYPPNVWSTAIRTRYARIWFSFCEVQTEVLSSQTQ
jgi:hypothetical protein